jgi:hypothetical protein
MQAAAHAAPGGRRPSGRWSCRPAAAGPGTGPALAPALLPPCSWVQLERAGGGGPSIRGVRGLLHPRALPPSLPLPPGRPEPSRSHAMSRLVTAVRPVRAPLAELPTPGWCAARPRGRALPRLRLRVRNGGRSDCSGWVGPASYWPGGEGVLLGAHAGSWVVGSVGSQTGYDFDEVPRPLPPPLQSPSGHAGPGGRRCGREPRRGRAVLRRLARPGRRGRWAIGRRIRRLRPAGRQEAHRRRRQGRPVAGRGQGQGRRGGRRQARRQGRWRARRRSRRSHGRGQGRRQGQAGREAKCRRRRG